MTKSRFYIKRDDDGKWATFERRDDGSVWIWQLFATRREARTWCWAKNVEAAALSPREI